MRLAILFCGQMRTFDEAVPHNTLKEHLFEPFKPDIFVSTWSNRGFSRELEGLREEKANDLITDQTLQDYYPNLKSYSIEDFNQWLDKLDPELKEMYIGKRDSWDHYINAIPQLYKLWSVNELKKEEEAKTGPYDVVVKLRPDAFFIETPAFNIQPRCIYHQNSGRFYWANRVYDNFFYGDSPSMDIMAASWHSLKSLFTDGFNNGLDYRDPCRLFFIQTLRKGLNVQPIARHITDAYRYETWDQITTGMNAQ